MAYDENLAAEVRVALSVSEAVINADALEDEAELSFWVQQSAAFALTLPPK